MMIKGARVVLKIDGMTYIDLHSEMMRAESAFQGGGIVRHEFKTSGGARVVLEFSPEDFEPRGDCDCEICG